MTQSEFRAQWPWTPNRKLAFIRNYVISSIWPIKHENWMINRFFVGVHFVVCYITTCVKFINCSNCLFGMVDWDCWFQTGECDDCEQRPIKKPNLSRLYLRKEKKPQNAKSKQTRWGEIQAKAKANVNAHSESGRTICFSCKSQPYVQKRCNSRICLIN